MKRKQLSKSGSQNLYKVTAGKVHKKNLTSNGTNKRGGDRL